MADSSMSLRILDKIENIINNDTDLEDFTIIPTDDNSTNKSPVLYQDHHLALESWAVKYVYNYVCSELFIIRPALAKRKLPYTKKHELDKLLIGALLINPDLTTFWNMRRELVECELLNVDNELNFSRLVLTRKAKSWEALGYRRWLIIKILNKILKHNIEPPQNLLQNELGVCQTTSELSQNNYHSWTYRIWLIENLGHLYDHENLITNELRFSEEWVEKHVSEHSGFHYREYLINLVKQRCSNSYLSEFYMELVAKKLSIINDASSVEYFMQYLLGKSSINFEFSINLINFMLLLLYDLFYVIERIEILYKNHESLWYYRRFVIFNLINQLYQYHGLQLNCSNENDSNLSGEKMPKMLKTQPNKVETSYLYNVIVGVEKNVTNSLNDSVKYFDYKRRHREWLKHILKIDL